MKRVLAGLVMLAAVVSFGSAHAAAQVIVAGPGASVSGQFDVHDVAVTAAPVVFVNADPIAPHNIVSDAKKNPSCSINCAPLFTSGGLASVGGVEQFSIAGIAPGDYTFHCALHPNMKGTLTIVA